MSRTKGAITGMRCRPRWEPKKWRLDHEACVLMWLSGTSPEEIAKRFSKSTTWVSLVLNTDRASEMYNKVRGRLPYKELSESYKEILEKSTQRVLDYINDDRIAMSTPGQMADRAMRAMEMIDSKLKKAGDSVTTNNNTLVFASEDSIDRLLTAMNKSNEVTEMHRKDLKEPLKLVSNG